MCDLYHSRDARSLLRSRNILFLGDSNVRSYYKDMIYLLEHNKIIGGVNLKKKLDPAVPGDTLVKSTHLHQGRDYFEIREYKKHGVHVKFHFTTKCYTKDIVTLISDMKNSKKLPDIIIMNSCLWDISRWGPNGVLDFKDNMVKLMKFMKSSLPEETIFIWTTVPPLSSHCRGGLLVKEVQFLQHSLRFDIMEGNMFAREVVVAHGFDVLDVHYYLRMQIHWRAPDGIHWLPEAVRHVTNLILTHIAVSSNIPLPGNFHGSSVERFKQHAVKPKPKEIAMPQFPKTVQSKTQHPRVQYLARTGMQLHVPISPFRKAIKEKMQACVYDQLDPVDEIYDGDAANDSVLNSSLYTSFDDSFLLDSSLDTTFNDAQPRLRSVVHIASNYSEEHSDDKKIDHCGPIRTRAIARKERRKRCPYSYC